MHADTYRERHPIEIHDITLSQRIKFSLVNKVTDVLHSTACEAAQGRSPSPRTYAEKVERRKKTVTNEGTYTC